jgi:phosphate uptake regulator
MRMESRKIQKVGAATLTISLPKEWVSRRKLKKGDQLFIVEEGDSLRILPAPTMEAKKQSWETFAIDADLCDERGLLERIIVGNYVLGRRRIVVLSSTRLSSEHIEEVRRSSKMLMGLGIIEETANRITLQCAIDPANYPLDALIKRLYNLGATMLEEAVEALVTGDRRLAEDAVQREDDADMMYWLILRLILSAQMDEALVETLGMKSRLEIAGYRSIARDLETVADDCETIARAVLVLLDEKVELSAAYAKQLRELVRAVTEVYGKAIGGLLSRDIKQANEAIRLQDAIAKRETDLVKLMIKAYDDPKILLPMRAVINGIVRMSDYGSGIAVIAFNRYLERPTNLAHPEK